METLETLNTIKVVGIISREKNSPHPSNTYVRVYIGKSVSSVRKTKTHERKIDREKIEEVS